MVGNLASAEEAPRQTHSWKGQPHLPLWEGLWREGRSCSPWPVTMATFSFVSLDPELLPRLGTGIQVRLLHDGRRKRRKRKNKTAWTNTHHTSWYREGVIRMSFQTSFHLFFWRLSPSHSCNALENCPWGMLALSRLSRGPCAPHAPALLSVLGSSLLRGEVSGQRSPSQPGFPWHPPQHPVCFLHNHKHNS